MIMDHGIFYKDSLFNSLPGKFNLKVKNISRTFQGKTSFSRTCWTLNIMFKYCYNAQAH
jgi:hypothetical protein